ncbi:hypothetical protein [Variovorax sp. DT-64]|uniref:hypothetical protein n=1 Tax=Variovorax sp. DT-64 TaxID=3396160 RepID=UPI003F196294
MQLSQGDRARWPWWLMTVLIVVSAVTWWQHDDAVVPVAVAAPPPVPQVADHAAAPDVCSASTSGSIETATLAPALKLEGTVIAGAGSFAMVRRTTDSQLLQLRAGDRVEGLVVTAIESDRVTLTGAGRSVVIEAQAQAAAVAPAVVAPPAQAVAAVPAPHLIPVEQLPAAYRGPAPEDEVLGH